MLSALLCVLAWQHLTVWRQPEGLLPGGLRQGPGLIQGFAYLTLPALALQVSLQRGRSQHLQRSSRAEGAARSALG